MFINSIIAGFMIGLGGFINLTIGSVLGAFLFSLGLLTIIIFQFNLFTGKAGYLSLNMVKPKDLVVIWFGNLVGTAAMASLSLLTYQGRELIDGARAIIFMRMSNYWYENIILGIFCGILMWIAVYSYKENALITSTCVAAFILSGMNHCIADMYYYFMSVRSYWALLGFSTILCSTIGNIIGCNIIPIIMKRYYSQ